MRTELDVFETLFLETAVNIISYYAIISALNVLYRNIDNKYDQDYAVDQGIIYG